MLAEHVNKNIVVLFKTLKYCRLANTNWRERKYKINEQNT